MKYIVLALGVSMCGISHALAEQSLTINTTAYTSQDDEYTAVYTYKDNIDNDDTSYFSVDLEVLVHSKSDTYLNPKELKYQLEGEEFGVSLGYDTVFWGVSETYNPVDIINRTNQLTTYDNKDKLGELMLSGQYFFDESTLSGYILPRAEASEYLDSNAVAGRRIRNEQKEKDVPGIAVRYQTIIDDLDIGISAYKGITRNPSLTPVTTKVFDAYYPDLTQFGLDAQYTTETTLYKLEYAHKDTTASTYALNAGIEYIFVTDIEISALLELLKSNEQGNIYQNDIMLGTRFDFANESGTEGIMSLIYDREHYSTIGSIRVSSRINDELKLSFDALHYHNTQNDTLIQNQSDSYALTMVYYF